MCLYNHQFVKSNRATTKAGNSIIREEETMRNLQRNWRRSLSFFLTLAIVFGMDVNVPRAAGSAGSTTIYVATTGNDNTGNGTSGSPYKTIKKAAEAATAGTTVLVREGTYLEHSIRPKVSGTDGAMIVFKPEPGAAGKVIIVE